MKDPFNNEEHMDFEQIREEGAFMLIDVPQAWENVVEAYFDSL